MRMDAWTSVPVCSKNPGSGDRGVRARFEGEFEMNDCIHEYKILPGFFEFVRDGIKTFEVRIDDRAGEHRPRTGCIMRLKEWDTDGLSFTGNIVDRRVSYRFDGGRFGLPDGLFIVGFDFMTSLTESAAKLAKAEAERDQAQNANKNCHERIKFLEAGWSATDGYKVRCEKAEAENVALKEREGQIFLNGWRKAALKVQDICSEFGDSPAACLGILGEQFGDVTQPQAPSNEPQDKENLR